MAATRASNGKLQVAAIGDLHVREDSVAPYRELFTEISNEADVLVLCGDLTNFGKVREAEILAADIRACTIPVIGVLKAIMIMNAGSRKRSAQSFTMPE